MVMVKMPFSTSAMLTEDSTDRTEIFTEASPYAPPSLSLRRARSIRVFTKYLHNTTVVKKICLKSEGRMSQSNVGCQGLSG